MALETHYRQWLNAHVITKIAIVVCTAAVLSVSCLHTASADEASDLQEKADQAASESADAQARVSELQAQVEQTAADYNDAQAHVDELQEQIEQTQARIDELNEQIPVQQQRSAQSVKTLYYLQEEGFGIIQAILSSETLDDFLTSYEYVEALNSHNNAQLQKLQDMVDELDEQESQLEEDTAQAQTEADRAQDALEQAQQAREQAEEEAVAKAQAEADATAAAEYAAKEKAAKEAAANEAASSSGDGVDSGNDAAEQPDSDEVEEVTQTVSSGDVNWSSDKQAFVDEWAGRIDNYLAGSPMAGQGKTFAAAAWDSGVDPRWSPAIATVESSTGAICFMPYNAWGWGSYSFGSWEEAIPAHVAYLGSMYGSTITREAASIYCPPNASFWYNRCLEEMNKI